MTRKDIYSTENPLRPTVHYSPPYGFMNDPNGMVYTSGRYHLYYQLNPKDTVVGNPCWGHATTEDLIYWEHHGIAIANASVDEGVFSGSAVVDSENSSGLFDNSVAPNDRIVALFTSNTPRKQTQDLAYSLDGGYTFARYENNPVIDIGSSQFRDPKVFYHDETARWVMVVAKATKYEIAFYVSTNLIYWEEVSTFTGGIGGYQYEVPDLVKLPIEGTDQFKWVLFISINPGAPVGGSATQYFIGEFDGTVFVPDDSLIRMADHGKDWYAFQSFSNTPAGEVIGLAWASNWQYTNDVPTDPWRGAMSLCRKMSLRRTSYNPDYKGLTLVQCPQFESSKMRKVESMTLSGESCSVQSLRCDSGVFQFKLNVTGHNLGDTLTDSSTLYIRLTNDAKTDEVVLGLRPFDTGAHFFIDRGESFEHPMFNRTISVYVNPENSENPLYDIHGIIDRGIIEVYIKRGEIVFTNTVFLPGINNISIAADKKFVVKGEVSGYTLVK